MIFSKLTAPFDQPMNRLYAERRRLQAKNVPLLDLVSGNVSEEGIHFPPSLLARAVARGLKHSRTYHPNPLGQPAAREAISRYYKKEGLTIPPEQIVLTPGTSLAYAYLFQTLADPGDEILCPQPSYPLFSMIADAAHVRITSYTLRPAARWTIDFESLDAAITPRTRAIVLVSPHNPTGAVATEAELQTLAEIAARRQLPIISDEVFGPFLFTGESLPRPALTRAPLVLTLNGLSKMFALPGLKLGWIAVSGDPALVKKTMTALEMLSDTYLPVNEAVQAAAPILLKKGWPFFKRFQTEVRRRTEVAVKNLIPISGIRFIPPEGGFYVTLKLEDGDEEELCWQLLTRHHTAMHPGFFYDMEGAHLILSLVHRTTEFQRGLKALKKVISR